MLKRRLAFLLSIVLVLNSIDLFTISAHAEEVVSILEENDDVFDEEMSEEFSDEATIESGEIQTEDEDLEEVRDDEEGVSADNSETQDKEIISEDIEGSDVVTSDSDKVIEDEETQPEASSETEVEIEDIEIDGNEGSIDSSISDDNVNEVISERVEAAGVAIGNGDIWLDGFEPDSLVYTGSAVKQSITVYDKDTVLTLNKDYTLTYKNNINASPANVLNAPSVTITMKGQYTGKKTLYYGIVPADISEADNTTDNIALLYNKKEQRYVPVLTFNGKKLSANKDFTIAYNSFDFIGNESGITNIKYTLTGIGNYQGTLDGDYYISGKSKNVSKSTVSFKSTYSYTGTYPTDEDIANAIGLKIKFQGDSAEYYPATDDRFEIKIENKPIGSGTAKIHIKGIDGGYVGEIVKNLKIVPAYKLSAAAEISSNFPVQIQFHKDSECNKLIDEACLVIKGTTTKLVPDKDYTVKYSNISKVGTAKVTFTGKGAYSGTITKSYKLVNDNPQVIVDISDSPVVYSQGGARPENISVVCATLDREGRPMNEVLVENVDYTVKYAKNNAVGTGEIKISGKGNYSKMEVYTSTFLIEQADLAACTITVADKAYSTKKDAYKSSVTVIAPNGKKLTAGKDYEKNIEYIYDGYDDPASPNYRKPAAGSIVTVKLSGMGNYKGIKSGEYKVYDSKKYSLSKLYMYIDSKEYSGAPIVLDLDKDIHIYSSKSDMDNRRNELKPATKYVRVISYKNNIKAGKATVVLGSSLSGDSEYGGEKAVSFTISKKGYISKSVEGIRLSKSSVSLIALEEAKTERINAIINPTDADNKNVVWKLSKSGVVEIIESTNEYAIVRTLGTGQCELVCTTQDGNKTARCAITSKYTRLEGISISRNMLSMKSGDSYKLECKPIPSEAYMPELEWNSSDISAATVDNDGTVHAVAPGQSVITARGGSVSVSCTVIVLSDEYVAVTDIKYGAIPDDGLDDTDAIKKAISSAKNKPVGKRNIYFPSGVYNVSIKGECAIDLNDARDLYFKLEPDAVIRVGNVPNSPMNGIITLDRASNIVFDGGIIEDGHGKDNAENHFCIMIVRSSNVDIKNMTIKNPYNDGIYVGKDTSIYNTNINISECIIDGARRNSIALVNAKKVTIDNCTFRNAKGYNLPGYGLISGLGVDIEPNYKDSQVVDNVSINNCIFENNREDFGVHCHVNKKGCDSSMNVSLNGCSFSKLIWLDCGTNITFTNTKKKPTDYYDRRTDSRKFPE